ncbi:MAG TPA: hypothetical protein VLB32_04610 [Candidatus Acidoferrales bacterium]|nr:hypothetical protein [Candidatus Acidoferrales bacterium]
MPAPLTDAHLLRLQALSAAGFELVALPRFPGYVGAKKYDCAVLLEPLEDGRLRQFTAVGYLIEGNISVLVQKGGEQWFVWKAQQVRATPELLGSLKRFETELAPLLK